MKIVHLSDLHLGKRLNEFSMLEDQKYILTKIVNVIDDEKPDAVVIAGDVYDKAVPSAEAVELFDDFLVRLGKRSLQVFVISGNHDSPERIAFGGRLMNQSGIHMSPVYNGQVLPISIEDEFGSVLFYMIPFLKPANVRRFFPDDEIMSYTNALRTVVDNISLDVTKRNVLITHQFVTGALRSDSEDISVGGANNVDGCVFENFDYVALGHIHGPQTVGKETVRYCGTPLKYSFSESNHIKSVTVVDIAQKGDITIRTVPIVAAHDMREIKGNYMELTAKQNYEGTSIDDYLHITLTDEEDVVDAIGKLRVIYPNIMKLDYDNKRTRNSTELNGVNQVEQKTPLQLLAEFYEKQNNQPMNAEQTQFVENFITQIWEGEQ